MHIMYTFQSNDGVRGELAGASESDVFCQACHFRLRQRPVDVRLDELPSSPCAFLSRLLVPIFGVELIREIGNAVERDCWVGSVFLPDGTRSDCWCTLVGRRPLIMRSDARAQHRVCERCGRLIYRALGAQYFLRHDLVEGCDLYQCDNDTIAVTDRIMEVLPPELKAQFIPWRVAIGDKPLDGLPAKLDLYPTTDQLAGYRPNWKPIDPEWWKTDPKIIAEKERKRVERERQRTEKEQRRRK